MTKIQTLNTASDLRRIANWTARGEVEKLNLIKSLLAQIKDKKTRELIDKFRENIKVEDAFKEKKKQNLFAEGMLTASIILQNKALNS